MDKKKLNSAVKLHVNKVNLPITFNARAKTRLADAFKQLIGSSTQEIVLAAYIDSKGNVRSIDQLFMGGLSECAMYPGVIMQHALAHKVSRLVIAHNHPTGGTDYSTGDEKFFKRFDHACLVTGLHLEDAVIVTDKGSFSSKNNGCLFVSSDRIEFDDLFVTEKTKYCFSLTFERCGLQETGLPKQLYSSQIVGQEFIRYYQNKGASDKLFALYTDVHNDLCGSMEITPNGNEKKLIKDLLQGALWCNAASVMVVSHVSNQYLSKEIVKSIFGEATINAFQVSDVTCLDYVIVSEDDYVSAREYTSSTFESVKDFCQDVQALACKE